MKNVGSQNVTIIARRKGNKNFSFGTFSVPVTVLPGASVQLPVNFAPIIAGNVKTTISIISSAPTPKLLINVSGTGVNANTATLAVSPTSLNFGNVTVGSTANLPITLTAMNGPVTISSAQINSSEFSLPGFVVPKTISTGQSLTVTAAFTPKLAGTASANLVLTSDAANSPNTVPLTGVGVAVIAHNVALTWNASQDVVIGYDVYRAATQGGSYTKINPVLDSSTSYTDSTVKSGTTYYYVVTAIDANDVESARSNEVQAVVPSP
ncbi:MAG: choice-of-anchor D domain-containing protein [Acidobacteria bacterium]|nr:choice-of-anchor D domain-containing protein [Acidobacteriota bacterium]